MPAAAEPEQLTGLAAALTGDADSAARLIAETMAASAARRAADEAALRSLLVQQYLRRPRALTPPAGSLPAEQEEVVNRLVALSPTDRAALVLVRLSGLTLGEVGGILELSPTALRRRIESAELELGADPLAVRATLEALSWRVPEPQALRAARFRAEQDARRRRGRTRLVAVALGLALLAALAVPTVRMLRPLPLRTAGDWVFSLALDPPPGWRTGLHAVIHDQEFLQLSGEGRRCELIASLPSAPRENRVTSPDQSERAWVNGRPVQFSDAYSDGAGVRWPYGDGGEVTLVCDDRRDRSAVLGMAERTRFTTGERVSLPFTLDRLPEGFRVTGVGYDSETPLALLGTSRQPFEGDQILVRLSSDDLARESGRRALDAQVYLGGGEVGTCRPEQGWFLCVSTFGAVRQTAAGNDPAVRRAIDRVRSVEGNLRVVTDLADRSTWVDAREALPQ